MNKEQQEILDSAEFEETVELSDTEKQQMEEVDNMENIEVVYVEKEGFFKENGKTIAQTGAVLAGAASLFTSGFITGKYTEKKKRDIFMKEISTRIKIIEAEAAGEEFLEVEGEQVSTSDYKVEEVDDLIKVISAEFLKNKKVKQAEKQEWTNLAVLLATAGAKARAKQITKDKEVVQAND